MGLGKLQIWITAEGSPCTISERDEHDNLPWEVAIMHCNGRVLKWCGRKYVGLIARCGHLEVDVPPGCYVIRAGENMGVNAHGGITGNHLSDHAVVNVCGDQTVCVMLFAPSLHNCLFATREAVQGAMTAKIIPVEIGRPVVNAIKALSEQLPKSTFDEESLTVMEELLKNVEKPKKSGEDSKK